MFGPWKSWPNATWPISISGKVDRVEVAYMKFINAARQTPVVETLLPLSTIAPEPRNPGAAIEEKQQPDRKFDQRRIRTDILEQLLPEAFKVQQQFKVFPGRGSERTDRPPL